MEEKETKEKEPKKNNKATLIIFAAIVFIVAGAVLILTGNNINLMGNDKDKTDEQETPKDDPKRGTNQELTVEEAKKILDDKKASEYPEAPWTIDEVVSLERGDNNAYLVVYKTTTDGVTDELQTIIFVENGTTNVELPGWHNGDRDLTSYNFGNPNTPSDPVVEPPVENPPVENPPVEEPPVEEPPVENPPVENPPVENPGEPPVEAPAEPQVDEATE